MAAASVLAKVERDALLVAAHERYPAYGWAGNKGYSAPEHLEALGSLGACPWHRRSWSLPTGPRPVADTLPLEAFEAGVPVNEPRDVPGATGPAESA